MDRDSYIRKSLAKLVGKTWEHYVVNRLVHRLDDPEIEFICQQHVAAGGARFLTDVYFPQFELHLEIDEVGGHARQEERDSHRSDIILAKTKHQIVRIATYDKSSHKEHTLATVNKSVDRLVERLKDLKEQQIRVNSFVAWTADNLDHPEQYYKKGSISSDEHAIFRSKVSALRCFGFNKEILQHGTWRIPERPGFVVWFPRFFEGGTWVNELSEDETIITEKRCNGNPVVSDTKKPDAKERYVFGKIEDVLGNRLFRFLGHYQLDEKTGDSTERRFVRVASTVSTIAPPGQYDPHKKFGGSSTNPEASAHVAALIAAGKLKLQL